MGIEIFVDFNLPHNIHHADRVSYVLFNTTIAVFLPRKAAMLAPSWGS